MRVLACADIHGHQGVYVWLAAVVVERHPDAVVLAGDLFGFPDEYATIEEAQEAEGRQAAEKLALSGTPVLFVMGNDDWIDWMPAVPSIRSIHGRRAEIRGMNFVGYQNTLTHLGGPHERTEEQIRADLEALAPLVDGNTVFVTHGPARRSLDRTAAGERIGSSALSDFLERRAFRAHIHGHVHHAFGRQGDHFNVAAAAIRRAMLIDLDTMRHEVITGEGPQ
jgi:Icc-related predicted phosphoesterase